LYRYENKVRDFIFSLWELPTRPVRNWKFDVTAEVSREGYISMIHPDFPRVKDSGPEDEINNILGIFKDEMYQSVNELFNKIENRSIFNTEGDYFRFPLPPFIADSIPSWQSSNFKLPIKITLDSEVINSMDDLPKTQKRDRLFWRKYSDK
jgi:hypothetical protein